MRCVLCTIEIAAFAFAHKSRYTRGARITRSEFAWLGETSIALWGYTRGSPVPGMGPDTTGGDQPRGTYIGSNIFREIGVWQKQSAAVFQAEAGDRSSAPPCLPD